ncbi:hypothetical protein GGU11DRAFT_589503 [Lentinula aff. detonsa]|uniref:Transferase family protein n=1 Tax=Lentinula aff. detonsa TaxID=2804958 RepID=A0AA38KQA9_9AGAR|nr:hypothetical protein GGU10DRAFT_433915 [Lentinula aff. detonsa]KAJ3798390.1 hypothetical protein GGU11DRAFT_589503 [Lentinula aff. detonsa]
MSSHTAHTIVSASITSRRRIFPFAVRPGNGTHLTKALSIVDGSVLRYSPARATWFFDAPALPLSIPDTESLATSLSKVLNSYPQWSGSLHMPHPNADTNSTSHDQRFNRPQLTWGTDDDPGVEFIEAQSLHRLSLLPTPEERARSHRIWDASIVAPLGTMSDTPKLALHDRVSSEGLPCMVVQITKFACGGIAIAVKFAHPLADAQTLLTFIHDWAAVHRGLTVPIREFAPELLDRTAAGDIDASLPDRDILSRSGSIPLHKFDWWASGTPDCPPFMLPETEIPSQFADVETLELGRPLPWKTWDILAPVRYYVVHFTRQEIINMWQAATSAAANTPNDLRLSKLDALLAHIWTLIIRARELSLDNSQVHLDVTLGLRPRVSPTLSPCFIGSPLLNIPISQPASQISMASALLIRSSMAIYNPEAIGALLHEMAYMIDPSRRWNTFLGERHTIVTSWLESRPGMTVYDVDFGFGAKPRMVDSLLFECDGCVQIMESGSKIVLSNTYSDSKRTPWYDTGVSVGLHFKEDVMERMLADPWFRKYDK